MMLLIALVLQATSILPAPAPPPDNQVGLEAMRDYQTCVVQAALRMEWSKEAVSLIADTAVGTCPVEREVAKERAEDWIMKMPPYSSSDVADEAAEGVMKKSDADLRADTLAALLTQRASTNPVMDKPGFRPSSN